MLLEQLENIKTREELSDFVLALVKDFKNSKNSWENDDLASFLEAISAWIRDMNGFYRNQEKELPDNIHWKIFAEILFAAKSYE